MKIITKLNKETRKKYHIITGISIECSGQDCIFCNEDLSRIFEVWESSIPYPIPPKGKKYKKKIVQKNSGKTILEICYTCRKTPCYICTRSKCDMWMKEKSRKGQEEGCVGWAKGKCQIFRCEKRLIKFRWDGSSTL